MPSPRLCEDEFKRRFRNQFQDPSFDRLTAELDRMTQAAWGVYEHSRKSPHTRKAGPGFADPDYDLALDWVAAAEALKAAARRHDDAAQSEPHLTDQSVITLGAHVSSEMSKSFRLAQIAREAFDAEQAAVSFLDLSRVAWRSTSWTSHLIPPTDCIPPWPKIRALTSRSRGRQPRRVHLGRARSSA